MAKTSSNKRYAQAAFELAKERDGFEGWEEGLRRMADLTAEEALMALLQNPRLPFDVKRGLLQEQLEGINPLAFNLALLLVAKGMLGESSDILQQYRDLLNAHRGIERAKVITALPLDEGERKAVSLHLEKMVGRKVAIDGQVDPSIIGGFIARIGDRLIDGSIRQRLNTLKKDLVEAGR